MRPRRRGRGCRGRPRLAPRRGPVVLVASAVVWLGLVAAPWLDGEPAHAQGESDRGSAILVMDSSGSMLADDGSGRRKIDAAKEALLSLVDRIPAGAPVGLEVYGARVPNTDRARGCRDIELVVPVGPIDPAQMKARIRSYQAKGFTPIGRALRRAAAALPEGGERTIVLVSDGIDTCAPPDPCQVARELARQGIDLRIQTIGFQVDARARRQLQCIARVSGGEYRDAPNADELEEGLQDTFSRALRLYRPQGTPVTGGSGVADAPTIGPGQYVDTITPGQERWYIVEAPGAEKLFAACTLVPPRRASGGLADAVYLRAALLRDSPLAGDDSLSQDDAGLDAINFRVRDVGSVAVVSQPIAPGASGRRYLKVDLPPSNAFAGTTVPIELLVSALGADAPPPAPPPAPESPDPSASSDDDSAAGDRASLTTVAIVAVAVACALVGGAAAAALVALRRRRRST